MTAKPAVLVAAHILVGGLAAQDASDEQRIASLIEQLHDSDALIRDTATHRLVALGRPAALALGGKLEESETIDVAVVRTLGKMGPDALGSLGTLLDHLGEQHDQDTLRTLEYAVLGIDPFSDQQNRLLTRLVDVAQGRRMLRLARQNGRAGGVDTQMVDVVIANSAAIVQVTRAGMGVPELVEWLGQQVSYRPQHTVGVATALGRSGTQDVSALEALQEYLSATQRVKIAPELIVPFAEAILRLDSSSEEAIDAHAYLIQHGDAYQQGAGSAALRGFGERAGRAAGHLTAALQSDALHARVLGEMIITAGIIGPFAEQDEREVMAGELRRLTEHEDAQIAARAKAALRQIMRRGR